MINLIATLLSKNRLRERFSDPRFFQRSLATTVGIVFLFLLWSNRNTWFFGDDFAFVFDRYLASREGRWTDALLLPHNEHWATLPALIHIFLQSIFGINHHLIFVIPVIAAHCAAVWVVSRMVYRVTGDGLAAMTSALALGFMAAGHENLLWGFQVGFVGAPVLVLLATTTCYQNQSARNITLASLLCALAVMTQGTALSALFIPFFILLMQRRIRDLVLVIGPSIVLFVGWFLLWGSQASHSSPTNEQRLLWPQYVWKGIQSSLDGFVNLPGAGIVVLSISVVGLSRSQLSWRQLQFPIAMAATAPLFFALSAFGRLQYGIDQAGASRYQYLGILYLAPLLIIGIYELTPSRARTYLILLPACVWFVASGVSGLASTSSSSYPALPQFRQTIEAAALLSSDPDVMGGSRPSPQFNPNVTVEGLRRLMEDGLFNPNSDLPEAAWMEAALYTTLAIAPTSDIPINPKHQVVGIANGSYEELSKSCGIIEGTSGLQIVVDTNGSNPILISTVAGGEVLLGFESKKTGARSNPNSQQILPNTDYAITGWLDTTKLVVTFSAAQSLSLCGVLAP